MTGKDLIRLREKLNGMTRRDLAKRLDVSERTIIRWECENFVIPRAVEIALKQIESEELAA